MDVSVKLHTKGRHFCGRTAEIDGDLFKYKAEAGGSVGVVKILEPMSPMLNYFEYKIVDKGRRTRLGIGVGEQNYPSDRMPGWNRNAIGYHADDGRLFHQDGHGRPFGPLCTTGDRMGCGVDFATDAGYGYVNVFFTKNGQLVGDPVKMKRPVHGLYPLVGLHSEGETVQYLGHWRRVPTGVVEPMESDDFPAVHWLRSNGVSFTNCGLTLEYAGEGRDRQDVGIAQACNCISTTNHYFEIEILDAGKEGWIALGLAKRTYPLTKHPGWCKGSVGYHADNGHLYNEKGLGDEFGPTCTTGDTMGCGVRFPPSDDREHLGKEVEEEDDDSDSSVVDYMIEQNLLMGLEDDEDLLFHDDDIFGLRRHIPVFGRRLLGGGRHLPLPKSREKKPSSDESGRSCTVYFTKNGELVGETVCRVPKGGFYPVVAMLSRGERVKVNLRPLSG